MKKNTGTITTRELMRNIKGVKARVRAGAKLTVTDRGESVFDITPHIKPKKKAKYTLEDVLKIKFNSGEKNLGGKIDEIVYGIKTR